MKVMCIKGGSKRYNYRTGERLPILILEIGTVYTVTDTHIHPNGDSSVYSLEEFCDSDWFSSTLFAPLSDIDEMELVNEKYLINESKESNKGTTERK